MTRTLKDYRPQHDSDCQMRRVIDPSAKCSCGLDTLLAQPLAGEGATSPAEMLAKAISAALARGDRTSLGVVRPILADAVNEYRRELLGEGATPSGTPQQTHAETLGESR